VSDCEPQNEEESTMGARRFLVTVAMVAMGLLPGLAAATGSGTFRSESTTLTLVDAYAFRGENNDTFGGRPTVVTLTTVPVEPAALDAALDREQALRLQLGHKDASWVELTLTPDGSSWVNAQLSLPNGSQSLSLSGVGTLELTRHDANRIEGRFFTSAEEAKGDKEFDLRFAVDVAPDPDPGTPLGAGGGEAGRAYVAYIAAVQKGDVDAMARYMAKDKGQAMLAARSQPDFKEGLEMFQLMSPKEVTVKGGSASGATATLEVEGKDADGNRVAGQVRMVKDGDTWRVQEESVTTYTQ
jgi:hypothetical protein